MEGGERDQLRDEFIDIPKPNYQNYMNSKTCEVKYLLKKQIREGGRRKEERCSVLIYTDQTYPSDIEKYEQKWKIENRPRFLAYFLISLTVIVIILCYHRYHNYHFFIIIMIIISVFIFIILQSAPLYLLKNFWYTFTVDWDRDRDRDRYLQDSNKYVAHWFMQGLLGWEQELDMVVQWSTTEYFEMVRF